MVVDVFHAGVGEQGQPWPHAAAAKQGKRAPLWKGWVEVSEPRELSLGVMLEKLGCSNPALLSEIESQGVVFILIKCLLLKEKTLYTLIGYILQAG